jgi:hypothetical protein
LPHLWLRVRRGVAANQQDWQRKNHESHTMELRHTIVLPQRRKQTTPLSKREPAIWFRSKMHACKIKKSHRLEPAMLTRKSSAGREQQLARLLRWLAAATI